MTHVSPDGEAARALYLLTPARDHGRGHKVVLGSILEGVDAEILPVCNDSVEEAVSAEVPLDRITAWRRL